jgi:hypothetical protein
MNPEPVREGFAVFVHDGDKAVGAVRQILHGGKEFIIYVEGGGDFSVPFSAVRHVDAEKVTLDRGKLGPALLRAIEHAHDAEDPRI